MKKFVLASVFLLAASSTQAQKSPSGNNGFDGLDKNRDGFLSGQEVDGEKELKKRFAKFDANKDGKWGLDDYIKANQDNDKRIAVDSTITTKLKAKFLAEKGIPSTAISVETYEGTVQLSGFVDSNAVKEKAGKLASGISGVKSVENKLSVK